MKIAKYIKDRWISYLNRLAKVNDGLYGSRRLDCCDLDRTKKPRT